MVSYLIKGRRDCDFIVVCFSCAFFSACVFSLLSLTADVLNAADAFKFSDCFVLQQNVIFTCLLDHC